VRVLTWNLYHGRTVPPCGRSRLTAFAHALAGWEWDVALLQEVPPWWPSRLAAATGARARMQLTSRNRPLAPRREISRRNPDLLKASGGGCNAILVRGSEVLEHRARRLRRLPERRWVHGVRLRDVGWVVNVHSHDRPEVSARADTQRAAAIALGWAAGGPLVFGGDVNLHRPEVAGLLRLAGNHVDHIFTDGRPAAGKGQTLDRGALSDHPPVAVTLA
jgi:endonuclease/exonuclease/phosphatase family metal-dependent hydrolase